MSSASSRLIVPALRGACVRERETLPSSSVLARQATGGHLFRIRGYSLVDRMVPAGEVITSAEFSAANHRWMLWYYPNGRLSTVPSVCVNLWDREGEGNVYAAYRVSILDCDGNPAYSFAAGPERFAPYGSDSSTGELVSTEELRRSMDRLVDDEDCLNVRFDVNVLEVGPEKKRTDYHSSCTGEETREKYYSESDYSVE